MHKLIKMGIVATLVALTGCGNLHEPANEQVIGGEVVVDLSAAAMKSALLSANTAGVDENTTVYGYKAYKIPYTTEDEQGNSVEVSGLMVVPTGLPDVVNNALGLSVVSDSHGTIFANAEAPTVIAQATNSADGSSIILTSLGGFVTLQADYIGFGDSAGQSHPFVLKKSLANATIDFITAARTFARNNAINLNGQLFVTGYSEGGYAALASLEKMETEGLMEVAMAAPMAGPYDLNITAYGVLSQPTLSVPSFMANVGYAYALAYDEPLDLVINEPYASKLETLLDGSKTRGEIDAELTTKTTGVDGLFTPLMVSSFFSDPMFWFREAVVENSVDRWGPQTPVKLVHCLGDDVIDYQIATHSKSYLDAYGAADVTVVPVEVAVSGDMNTSLRYGHSECGPIAYGVAVQLFAEYRAATIGY